MDNAQAQIKQAGVETTWDKKAGQNYATWEADGAKYEIWLEDAKSIRQNLSSCRSISLQVPLSGLWDRKARISGI